MKNQIARLLDAGYGPDDFLVMSLTRAAAGEIAQSVLQAGLDLPKGAVGTLHSACYHALGAPELTIKHVADWNEQHPEYAMGVTSHRQKSMDEPEEPEGETDGDAIHERYQLYRNLCLPRDHWPDALTVHFAECWERWKAETGLRDFTDLLEECLRDVERAPGNPRFLLLDEGQDFNPLAYRLICERWAQHAEATFISADPWQALYVFAGANPRIFLDHPVPEDHKRPLQQSYRVPRTVHALALAWMREYYSLWETPVYRPRQANGEPVEGEVRHLNYGSYLDPEPLLDEAEAYAERGKTVMLLATCSYQLDPLKRALRARGLPFHCPARRRRRDWNPLYVIPSRNGDSKAIGGAARLLAYKRLDREAWGSDARMWTAGDLQAWVELVQADGVLLRGAKAAIAARDHAHTVTLDDLGQWLTPETWGATLIRNDLAWLESHLLPSKRELLEYPLEVYRQRGASALREEPKLLLGTVHAFKGWEADTVMLCPDLSRAGYLEWTGSDEERDNVARVLYVGMTRARESLLLAPPATRRRVPWPE